MEAHDPDTIVDTTTGVSTAVPPEHRANGASAGGASAGGSSNGHLGGAASRAKSLGTPVVMQQGKLNALRTQARGELSHTTAGDWHGAYRHPILQLTKDLHGYGVRHDAQLLLWHAMREYIPPLDAAISNRRALEGDLVIEADDEGLESDLQDWWESVPVGVLGENATFQGGNVYLNMLADNADEYGLCVGEKLLGQGGRSIRRLVAPNMRTISSADRDQDGIYELYQNTTDELEREGVDPEDLNRLDNRPTVDLMAFRPSTETEWPYPLAWSLKQTGEAFLRIVESTVNGWWRFGDPSMHFNLQFDAEAEPDMATVSQGDDDESQGESLEVPSALIWLRDGMAQVMDARREGKVSDMYSYVDGGELSQEVIGQIDSTLMEYVEEHKGQIAAEVIEHSETPPWMYPSIRQTGDGLGSQRSMAMGRMADKAAGKRNQIKKRIARDVIDTELTARGDSQWVGQYRLSVRRPEVVSEEMLAEARLKQAQADQQRVKTAGLAFGPDGQRRFEDEAGDYIERNSDVYPSEE